MKSSVSGTILELRAIEWLLSHGFRVWRAVDGAQTGDLVMDSSLGLLEVEVRAGRRRRNRPGVYFRQLPQDTADLYLVMIPGEPWLYWRAILSDAGRRRSLVQAYPIVTVCRVECTE